MKPVSQEILFFNACCLVMLIIISFVSLACLNIFYRKIIAIKELFALTDENMFKYEIEKPKDNEYVVLAYKSQIEIGYYDSLLDRWHSQSGEEILKPIRWCTISKFKIKIK